MNLTDIRNHNLKEVYHLVYKNRITSKPDIAGLLSVSLPTASQRINELIEEGLVREDGFLKSTGGRKAAAIRFNSNLHTAIGLYIKKDCIELAAIDLYGEIISSKTHHITFENNELYCALVANHVNSFFIELNMPSESLLGVGMCIQGLANSTGDRIEFGPIPAASGFSASDVGRFLPFVYSPFLKHDTELAATYASWRNPEIENALYLVLNQNIGGAVILNGQTHKGNTQPSGLIAHMTLNPHGKPCYCGKKGCVEAYCSGNALLEDFTNDDYESFFKKLRDGEDKYVSRWDDYLSDLSLAIYNYQVLLNTEVLISGTLAPFITAEDLKELSRKVSDRTGFSKEVPSIKQIGKNNVAPGAALYFVVKFLKERMPDGIFHFPDFLK